MSEQHIAAWFAVYVEDGDIKTDLHQKFADKIGQGRQDAKRLAHIISFRINTSDFMREQRK